MKRRALLAGAAGAATLLTSGCLGAIPSRAGSTPTATPSARARCADRKVPGRHLGVVALEASGPPEDPSTVIRYDELSTGEQSIVERAIEQGRFAVCLPAADDDRVEAFGSLVERVNDHAPAVTQGPYLAYGTDYYRFTTLRTGDQVYLTAAG